MKWRQTYHGSRRVQRRNRWWPRRLYRKKTREQIPPSRLPGLPRHTETAVLHMKGHLRKRKQRHVERTLVLFFSRWRITTSLSLVGMAVASGVGVALIVSRDALNDSGKPPSVSAPSKVVIEDSIRRGQDFAAALYKSLDNGQAVQSEASGVPFRVHYPAENVWVLLGQDQSPSTSISNEVDTATTQSYDIGFDSPTTTDALKAHVKINWAFSDKVFQISIAPQKVREPVQLWLDRVLLTTFDPGPGINLPLSFTLPNADKSLARMNRYTVRHATQEAYLYWTTYGKEVPGAPQRAAALGRFLVANRYQPGLICGHRSLTMASHRCPMICRSTPRRTPTASTLQLVVSMRMRTTRGYVCSRMSTSRAGNVTRSFKLGRH